MEVSDRNASTLAQRVALRRIPGKGLGLLARRDMPAHTRVGVYGGDFLSKKQKASKYAVHLDDKTLDPGRTARDVMRRRVVAAFINEPGPGVAPNAQWVRNFGRGTMELWTTRRVRRGEELTSCYGADYARKYQTSCTKRRDVMQYVKPGMRAPRTL